jgi:multidrug efflux pump subunit AcrB
MFLIFVVLLAQFNRFLSVALVLSAVVMSTIGVFLGLLIMGQPFGIVMTGIGVIALAGVVVNNNIVLIDTYDHLRERAGQARRHSRNLPRARKAGGADRRDRHPRVCCRSPSASTSN